MRYLPELTGANQREIHKAELIRYNANYKFEHQRYDKYFNTFTDAKTWIDIVDYRGEVTEMNMKRMYNRMCR